MANIDVLSDVFATLKLRSGIYFRTELTGAFAIEIPVEQRRIRFHLVRQGTCWARAHGMQDWLRLSEGDLAIIPNGAAQILADTLLATRLAAFAAGTVAYYTFSSAPAGVASSFAAIILIEQFIRTAP